jgi:hypothetical protein
MPNYIPRKDVELVLWSVNFGAQIAKNAEAWNISSDEVVELQTVITSFASLQAMADSPSRTTVIVAKKNAARYSLEKKIRELVNFQLNNPVITSTERIAMGLHVRSGKYSTVSRPETRPELEIAIVDFRRLKIIFRNKGSINNAKPYMIIGAVIAYAILDAPPDSLDAFTRMELATRSPYILEFTEKERGRTVYIIICWQNKKGERGPWSEIVSAIVP